MSATLMDIPIIDIAPFVAGPADDRDAVVRAVRQACEEVGFLIIRGHGIDSALLDRAFAVSRDFFDLPVEQKMRARPIGEVVMREYGFTVENVCHKVFALLYGTATRGRNPCNSPGDVHTGVDARKNPS